MSNFSFEPLKLKLATNNIIIPMENGVADLTNAETSAKIMLAGKELFPIFDESIEGRNYFSIYDFVANNKENGYNTIEVVEHEGKTAFRSVNISQNHLKPKYLQDKFEENTQYYLKFNILWESYTNERALYIFMIQYTDGTASSLSAGVSVGYRSILSDANKTIDYITTTRQYNGDVIVYDVQLQKGTIPTDWTPAPEDVLQNATLTSYNCSAAIVGDLVKITSHKPGTTRGWVDVTVNYGNLSNTKRLNWSVEGVEPYKPLGTLLTMNNRGIKL